MDKLTTKRTELLAPVFRMLEANQPNYKAISCQILKYFDLEELSYVLSQRRQNWQVIYEALKVRLDEDRNYQRIVTIIDVIKKEPVSLEEINDQTGFHKITISQTLRALDRGGYGISSRYEKNKMGHGGPITVYWR